MNSIRYFSILIICLIANFQLQASLTDSLENLLQSKIHDTLKLQIYTDLNWEYLQTDLNKAEAYAKQELDLASALGNSKFIAQAYNDLGIVCIKRSEFKKGLLFHQKALNIRLQLKQDLDIASSYSKIGYCYSEMDYYGLALKNQLQALAIYQSLNDKVKISYTLNNICFLYSALYKWDKVIELARQSLAIAEELGDVYTKAVALNNIGSSFEEKKEFKQAIQYKLQALEIFKQVGDSNSMASMMNNIGYYYRYLHQDDLAELYYVPGLAMATRLQDKNSMALFHSNLGALYTDKRNFTKALYHLNKAEQIAKEQGLPSTLIPVYQHYGDYYIETGNAQKARESYDIYTTLKDSIFNSELSKQFSEMQTKFETNEKESKNQMLEKENELKQAELDRSQIVLGSLVIGMLLLAILFYFIYANYKIKQQQKMDAALLQQEQIRSKAVLEAEENERQRIARDLHDGLGQRLSAAKLNISGLHQTIESDKQNQELFISNALSLLDESVKDVRSISHNLMANGLIKSGLVSAVREFIQQINSSNSIRIHIETLGLEERLNQTIENVLYRVLQELVNNIIKHAQATQVNIQLIKHDHELNLLIEDNGMGFNLNEALEKGGIGIKNIQSRINFINGKIDFDSYPGKGTTVNIEIPIS
ncbi:MAG: tetratricopeptide repeat-containing sensor histidine kinase [Bacteroidia bacterium]